MLRTNKGSVKISSDEDIQVFSGDFERIKIGEIENNKYGIRISKEVKINGIPTAVPVMVTDDDGELWLENRLKIGDGTSSTVELGYLDETRADGTHEVIHAGTGSDEFIVYEDGKVVANYIEANGGKIGNMTIESIENRGYELVITSNIGNSMKAGEQVELTATLYKGTTKITEGVTYQWYNTNGDIFGATGQKYLINSVQFNNGFAQYGCKVELKEENNE